MSPCRTTPCEREAMWINSERKNYRLPPICCDSLRRRFDDPNFVKYRFIDIEVVSENELAMRLIISGNSWRR